MNQAATPEVNHLYPKSIQKVLNWFAFFLALPVVDILGISITFFLFGYLFLLHNQHGIPFIRKGKNNRIFWLFLLSAIISTVFHPQLMEPQNPFVTVRNVLQIIYWVLLALYIISNYTFINWINFSKYVFWGILLLVILYYLIPYNFNTPYFSVDLRLSRNSFVYNILSFFPLIFLYVRNSGWKKLTIPILIYFVMAILLSNGRAGFLLIIVQTVLIAPVVFYRLSGLFRLSILLVFLLIGSWFFIQDSQLMDDIAQTVEHINPRAASLLSKSGNEGNLSLDKSWLIRKLMVDKSLEIASEYPLFGVGWFNFNDYGSRLSSLNQYERLGNRSDDFYNTRSAHNSYAQLLAEGGILGLALLILIFLPTIRSILNYLLLGGLGVEGLPLIAMFTLMIYFYVIAALTGANTWFLIGMSYALSVYEKRK